MSFLHPGAFAGLASILVLILLSLWRHRPARVVVPSVRLWQRIPDRLPPVRSMQRPRASLSLFLQMIVAASIVAAMAGPGVVRERPAPRRIAVVIDLSARMAPRMADVRRELAKLDPADEITVIESPSLARRRGLGDLGSLQAVDRAGDPGNALDLAAADARRIVFVGDRAPSWTPPAGATLTLVLVGGPLRTVGIVDAGVEEGKLFVRLNEPAPLEVRIDGRNMSRPPATFHLLEIPPGASRIEAALAPDEFPADDRVVLERAASPIEVGFEGRPDAAILAAIESNPRARVVRGGAPKLVIRVGEGALRGAPSVRVDVDPVDGVEAWMEPAALAVARHPLMEGVEVEDLKFAQVGRLSGPFEEVLVRAGEAPVAAVRRRGEIVLAVRYAVATGWPARPSFPIFWANVVEYAASGSGAWRARGLLDEPSSRPGTESRPFVPGALEPRPLASIRADLTGIAAALAALFLLLLWRVEGRGGA